MIEIKFDKEKNKAVAIDSKDIIGECDFVEFDNYWNITHTVVNNSYQGQGIARKLVECIINKSKDYNKYIKADCSYAKMIIEKVKKQD